MGFPRPSQIVATRDEFLYRSYLCEMMIDFTPEMYLVSCNHDNVPSCYIHTLLTLELTRLLFV